MAFRVGQKVVCVDDSIPAGCEWWLAAGLPWIKRGVVYTVAAFTGPSPHDGTPCISLVEMARPEKLRQWRFKPAVDISDLQAIVREQMLGKPRKIAPDKFDRQRVTQFHSASQADAGSAVPEAAPPACAEPAPVTTACRSGQCGESSLVGRSATDGRNCAAGGL